MRYKACLNIQIAAMYLGYASSKEQLPSSTRLSSRQRPAKDVKNPLRKSLWQYFSPLWIFFPKLCGMGESHVLSKLAKFRGDPSTYAEMTAKIRRRRIFPAKLTPENSPEMQRGKSTATLATRSRLGTWSQNFVLLPEGSLPTYHQLGFEIFS